MTKAHSNLVGEKYSIKIGNTVPKDGVNLAYIGNIKQDKSFGTVNIVNNKNYSNVVQFEQMFHTHNGNILSKNISSSEISTDDILVTDRFMETVDRTPLYYSYTCKHKIKKYVSVETTYSGPDINVTGINHSLGLKEKYKIVLTPSDSTTSFITVYTNFISDKDNAYLISYNKYVDGITTSGYSEIINLSPVYQKEEDFDGEWPGNLINKFKVEAQNNGTFNVYVSGPSYISQPENVRIEVPFTYQIDALVDSKCLPGFPKTLNVGVIQVMGKPSERVGAAIATINSGLPSHLTMLNPHPLYAPNVLTTGTWNPDTIYSPTYYTDKTIPDYWSVRWTMPKEHWYDYDLIIIAGAGNVVLTEIQRTNIEDFLRHGGNIWIDNNGLAENSILSITNFPTSFAFNYLVENHIAYEYSSLDYLNLLSRQSNVDPETLGYFENDNKFTVSSAMSTPFVSRHDPADMLDAEIKAAYEIFESKGHIFYTSTSIITGVVYRRESCISFVTNMFFRMAERKWYTSGSIHSTVLNKSSLFSVDYNSNNLSMPYVNSYDTDENSIALKKIIPNVYDKIREYIPELGKNDTISFYLKKVGDGVSIFPAKEEYTKNDIVSAYTLLDTTKWGNMVDDSNVDIIFPEERITYTIDAYYYKDLYGQYVEENSSVNISSISHTITISEKHGIYPAGFFNTLIPPSKAGWPDKEYIYYRIRTGEYDTRGNFVQRTPGLNFMVYDSSTGKNILSKDGTLTIGAYKINNTTELRIQMDYHYKIIKTRFFSVLSIENGILLMPPEETEPTSQWHLNIKNGKYSQTITRTYSGDTQQHGISSTYYYAPIEYDSQIFIPSMPLMYRDEEIANFVDTNIIQVENIPMVVTEEMPLKIVNRNKTINIKNNETLTSTDTLTFSSPDSNWISVRNILVEGGITPDPNTYTINYNNGSITFIYAQSSVTASYSYANDTVLEYLGYDANSGYIKLAKPISYNDNILASYYYNQDSYVYKGYNDNSNYMALDLNPSIGHYSTFKTITDGSIVYDKIDSYKLINKTIYVIMKPYKQDDLEVATKTIMHVFSKEDADTVLLSTPEAILLGEVQIRTSSTADDLVIFDTRRRGGGLKEGSHHKQAEYYWDISDWNGLAYQKQGSAIISIPEEVKNIYSESEIQDILNKNVAYGVVPIINYVSSGVSELETTILIRNNVVKELDMSVMIPARLSMTIKVAE
jgi:hypothetical protein